MAQARSQAPADAHAVMAALKAATSGCRPSSPHCSNSASACCHRPALRAALIMVVTRMMLGSMPADHDLFETQERYGRNTDFKQPPPSESI